MKYTIALCLVLAAGCNAFYSTQDVDFQPFLTRQQNAMRFLISAHAVNTHADLVNTCFDEYLYNQQNAMFNYNKFYTGCVNTAESEKNDLTAESAAIRQDLLSRSDNMCGVLSSCDKYVDGLEFFDCYRNASTDSYKIMFTLNSDANIQFNTISAKYDIINFDLKTCVDTARLDYARELEKCDADFNACLNGGAESSTTEAPIVTTEAPVVTTEAPVVTTEAPVVTTEAPVVTTEAPVVVPRLPVVTTEAPVVTTEAPVVSTEAPVVTTEAPVVTTEAPVDTTEGPVVTTEAPVDTTEAPVDTTEAPVDTTEAPVDTTEAPVDTTEAPVDTTEAPVDTTEVPVDTTEAPESIDTTEAQVFTTEKMPEEDIDMMSLTFGKLMNKLKRVF
ncbi:LOW QUALITY PROTEIN: uncharacterized protein LOC122757689 [Drosophila mojavensis]|uniref:LOW QUALITY PROTEIN: uncharacterized protein LOC122757689 n=1 Tax=Drosophila mojavensis TaxID=7230 RepID=UPI001CD105EF|nr:LOW QUALITY PROTEIN: uncharacterized protein LOC122757689 [Drosophila mojavensis]